MYHKYRDSLKISSYLPNLSWVDGKYMPIFGKVALSPPIGGFFVILQNVSEGIELWASCDHFPLRKQRD